MSSRFRATSQQAMTSPDGGDVDRQDTAGTGKEWTSVVYANGQYVMIADDTSSADSAMVSTDGITWSTQSQTATCRWTCAYGGGKYAAVANQNNNYGCGDSVIMTSDAITIPHDGQPDSCRQLRDIGRIKQESSAGSSRR